MTTPKKGSPRSSSNLGEQVEEVELFPSAAHAWEWHHTIMSAEMADNLEREWNKSRDAAIGAAALADRTRPQVRARRISACAQADRADTRKFHRAFRAALRRDLTPAAPGAAPQGLAMPPAIRRSARSGRCCGMPCITLPLLESANGLPIGVQLVGPRDGDASLLRTARWLAAKMAAA